MIDVNGRELMAKYAEVFYKKRLWTYTNHSQ